MNDSLFEEGGPYNIQQLEPGKHRITIPIPTDPDGLVGRECQNESCSPAYFKIKLGTGITEGQKQAYCPYCRHAGDPASFATKAQIEYAKSIVVREAHKGIGNMIEEALDLGPSRSRSLGGGFLPVTMTYKPGDLPHVWPPLEEELRRDVKCPNCGLEHAAFGLATWCPDCGRDIFPAHIAAEFSVVKSMLSDVERRRQQLGARVAARDVENALEDTVSIFEAALRVMTRRYMKNSGMADEEVESLLRKRIGNKYQNIQLADQVCKAELSIGLFEGIHEKDVEQLRLTFEKRHPITHNLGIVDRKYLEKARSGDLEGRDVPVTVTEIDRAIALSFQVLQQFHSRLFRSNAASGGS